MKPIEILHKYFHHFPNERTRDLTIKAMEDYAKEYHESELKKLNPPPVVLHSEQLIALQNIEKICDNQNPTHEEIWRIAYVAINSH